MANYNPNQDMQNILSYENNLLNQRLDQLQQITASLQSHVIFINQFLMNKLDTAPQDSKKISFININTYDCSGNLLSAVTTDVCGNFVPVLSSDMSGNWIPCILPPDLSNNGLFTRGIVPIKSHDGSRCFPYYPYPYYYPYSYPYSYPYYYGDADYDDRSIEMKPKPQPHHIHSHPLANLQQPIHPKPHPMSGQHIHIYPPGHH